MSTVIRIDSALLEKAKKVSRVEARTPSQQIAYWAKIGKAALENPDLPVEFIRDLMLIRAEKNAAEPFEFKR
jgi:hypothetical protein